MPVLKGVFRVVQLRKTEDEASLEKLVSADFLQQVVALLVLHHQD